MQLDLQLFYLLHGLAGQSPFLDGAIVFFATYLAYILAATFVLFLVLLGGPLARKLEIAAVALSATLLSRGIITEAIRYFFRRERPFTALSFPPLFPDSAASFPSGHATFFFALSTVLYLYDRRWGTAFFAASGLIVLARVAAGVHYPSDILAGAIIGVCTGYFVYVLVRRFWPEKPHQTY
jgi:undecaprenyl-diphosphatase